MRAFFRCLGACGAALIPALVAVGATGSAEQIAIARKLLDQGHVEAAIDQLERSVAKDPMDAALRLNLAFAYERSGRIDEAVHNYRESISLKANNFYARNNLGVLYDRLGRYDEAIAEFQAALRSDPSNPTALRNLETAKKNKHAIDEREAIISRAKAAAMLNPNDPTRMYELARTYAAYERNDEAVASLSKAVELGYENLVQLKTDPAFVRLRGNREFELLLLNK
jgi:Flp pilus assembly protein TadD